MAKIEIDIVEYQTLKKKINNLESALNTVSKETAVKKETIEQAKALVEDLQDESFVNRAFKWKKTISPLKELLNPITENGNNIC